METEFSKSFIGGCYTYRDRTISSQSSINCYVEQTNDDGSGKFLKTLVPVCGIQKKLELAYGEDCRGLYVTTGPYNQTYIWVVFGKKVYRVTEDFTNWIYAGEISEITQRKVSMADNGFELVITDGTQGYIWTAELMQSHPTIQRKELPKYTWNETEHYITPTQVVFLNQRFIINGAENQFGMCFFSELSSTDFNDEYGNLNFFTAEQSSDRLVAIKACSGKLWLFGERSIEVWGLAGSGFLCYESGNSTQYGCKSYESVQVLGENIYWQGSSNVGWNSMYSSPANACSPKRISTAPMEHEIEKYIDRNGLACSYSYEGHQFYCISFVGEGKTWCFDASTGYWHERAEHDYQTNKNDTWGVLFTEASSRHVIVGTKDGWLGYLSADKMIQLDGHPIFVQRTSPTFTNYDMPIIAREIYLDITTGTITDLEKNPMAKLDVSYDGGYTFEEMEWESFGKTGEYSIPVKWYNCGYGRDIICRLTITSDVQFTINGIRVTRELTSR